MSDDLVDSVDKLFCPMEPVNKLLCPVDKLVGIPHPTCLTTWWAFPQVSLKSWMSSMSYLTFWDSSKSSLNAPFHSRKGKRDTKTTPKPIKHSLSMCYSVNVYPTKAR